MSDTIYGAEKGGRYVARPRLEAMLDHEYAQIIDLISKTRSPQTKYFAFCDTVAAKAYKSDRDCHGWMGIRFQHEAQAESSQIVLHVRMLDASNRDQQEALGILGVNLIYSAFMHVTDPEALVAYVLSTKAAASLVGDKQKRFRQYVGERLADGAFRIGKDTGMFEAVA